MCCTDRSTRCQWRTDEGNAGGPVFEGKQLLLIDEPTNHLDLHARKLVSDYLNDKSGFILVSHDRAFLDNCVDHIISINKTNIEIQNGNFSDWWENKQRQDNFELAENEKLRKDIKRLSEAAKRTSNWSHEVEKRKTAPVTPAPRSTKDTSVTRPPK